jgi:DNA polymerase III sliding clamp (beta) subunit (PCNA family)
MKGKVKAGDLRDAVQLALITVDRRQGSELGYIYIGARKNKGASQRILLHSTDGVVKLLARVSCEVEEAGELIVDPMRLASIIERQADEAVVTISSDAGKGDRGACSARSWP